MGAARVISIKNHWQQIYCKNEIVHSYERVYTTIFIIEDVRDVLFFMTTNLGNSIYSKHC